MTEDPGPGRRRRWEWWHRQTTFTRRAIRASLTLAVTGVLAAVLGVTTASTTAPLGPNRAEYHMSVDQHITVQMGPLGALIIDSPLPWPLGVEVIVEEIPADLDLTDSPLPGLLADLQAYGQLFGAPEAAIADARNGLVRDAVGRTVVAWSIMLAALAAGRLASGGRLRDEVRAALARPGVAVLAGAVVLSGGTAVVAPAMTQATPTGLSPAILNGTVLDGAHITGRLADLVAAYGPVVRDYYEENEAFYATAAQNLTEAFAAEDPDEVAVRSPQPPPETAGTAEPVAPDATDVPPPGATDAPADAPPGPTAEASGATDAGETDGAQERGGAEDTTTAPAEEVEPDPVTFLMVSDLHCNVGMAPVIRAAVEASGAAAVLAGGDTVMSGTSVESYCVNAFDQAIPEGVPVVVATGNHDSTTTARQEEAAGWTVLHGDIVEVDGVRILGDTDPTRTFVGSGTVQERDETIPEMAQRLADTACAAKEEGDGVDILLVHNPRAGGPTLDRGCAPLQLSGHWHRTDGPAVQGQGVRYVSTSSGGGAEGGATLGPLQSPAEVTVLRVDANSGEPMDYRRVVIGTDASVEVGTLYAFPEVPPEPLQTQQPLPDGRAAEAPSPADGQTGG